MIPVKSAGNKSKSATASATKQLKTFIQSPAEDNNAQITSKKEAALLKKGKRAKIPGGLEPMLSTLVDKPFDEPGWIYEVKWDGYRAIAYMNGGKVDICSRNDKAFNTKFYPIYKTLKRYNMRAVIDGEIMVVNENGLSEFSSLQQWRSEADGELVYYVFDLLWLNGRSLMHLPLTERKEILRREVKANGCIRISENFDATGTEFFSVAQQLGLEGIIAKRADSLYVPGVRTADWLKIKTQQRQEVVIGGFTKNKDTSKAFSSLLVGVYEKDELIYTGKIGTGFTDKLQKDIARQMKPLIRKACPFEEMPDINKSSRFRPNPNATATWLKPELICEVSFQEMTADGVMRHPSFEGMRVDKKPAQVIRERAKKTERLV